MAIISPYNSFVQFNPDVLDCKGHSTQVSLPIYNNLSIKFQFGVDELLPTGTVFKAAVCDEDCNLIDNPDYEVVPLCTRFKLMTSIGELTPAEFPLLVGNYAPSGDQPQIPEGLYTMDQFLDAINEFYETDLPGYDFYYCCESEFPTISGIVVFLNGTGQARSVSLQQFYGSGYVNYPTTPISGIVGPGQCFRYAILDDTNEILACSNLFYREDTECKTTLFTYWNEENAYGFKYITYDDNGTTRMTENSIRLSVNFSQPDFNVEENVYRQPNGFQQRISTIISKEWLARTSWLSPEQHERLLVALKHDYLWVFNSEREIDYRMTQIGDYEVNYPEVDNPTAPAEFRINDYQQNNVNNNCGFNCGVEFVGNCDSDGGQVVIPCPEKYGIEFTGNDGVMTEGNTVYQNDNFIGKDAEVFREGLYQYPTGPNNVVFDPLIGEFTFTPAVDINERIAIWEV